MPSRRLVSFEIRSTPSIGFIPAGAVTMLLGVVAGRQPTGAEFRYLPLRLAIVSLVCAATFVFDDPAKTFSDPAPSPLHVRRGIRALVGVLAASCLFVIVLIPASDSMRLVLDANQDGVGATDAGIGLSAQPEFPWGRPALEMATMIGLALAIAGAVSRRAESEPGRVASGVLLAVYALGWVIPDRYRPWADPLDESWAQSPVVVGSPPPRVDVGTDNQLGTVESADPYSKGPRHDIWLIHESAPNVESIAGGL